METTLQTPVQQLKLQKNSCLTSEELALLGVHPTEIQCFTYYDYVLYQKEDKRIILKPLPHDLYKVIRVYNFISA